MGDRAGEIVAVAIPVILGITANADAAVGAAFGSMFFLLSSEHNPVMKRLGYAAVSLCIGYAVGLAVGAPWTMLASATSAAVAVVTLASLTETITKGGVVALMDIWRGRK